MSKKSRPSHRQSLIALLFTVFMRIMAAAGFYMGLTYWDLVIGLSSDGAIRFDIMTIPWRTASTTLAVLYPIASLGLWMGVSWGVVLWFAAAAGEIAMHTVWARIFGPDPMLITMHVAAAFLYAAFRIVFFLEQRNRRADVTLHSP